MCADMRGYVGDSSTLGGKYPRSPDAGLNPVLCGFGRPARAVRRSMRQQFVEAQSGAAGEDQALRRRRRRRRPTPVNSPTARSIASRSAFARDGPRFRASPRIWRAGLALAIPLATPLLNERAKGAGKSGDHRDRIGLHEDVEHLPGTRDDHDHARPLRPSDARQRGRSAGDAGCLPRRKRELMKATQPGATHRSDPRLRRPRGMKRCPRSRRFRSAIRPCVPASGSTV